MYGQEHCRDTPVLVLSSCPSGICAIASSGSITPRADGTRNPEPLTFIVTEAISRQTPYDATDKTAPQKESSGRIEDEYFEAEAGTEVNLKPAVSPVYGRITVWFKLYR